MTLEAMPVHHIVSNVRGTLRKLLSGHTRGLSRRHDLGWKVRTMEIIASSNASAAALIPARSATSTAAATLI